MNLFIQPNVEFVKTAAEVELPEDPNTWPKEVLDELYKQVPYIADFQPHVVMDKVDSERRYGMGHIEVSNQSEAQMGADPKMVEASGVRSVRIPIVIKNGKLSPFDLLVNDDSKVLPLTETRLRQAIFRPQAFDVTSQTPGDQSMIGQLYPPYRDNNGFGGGLSSPGGMMGKMGSYEEQLIAMLEGSDAGFRKLEKTASGRKPVVAFKTKRACILREILPTINKDDIEGFWEKVSSDLGLQARFRQNAEATTMLLGMLAQHEPNTTEKVASVLPSLVHPTVVQVQRQGGAYMVKAASHHYWRSFTELVDRGELVKRFGTKVAMVVDTHGAVTIADGCSTAETNKTAAAVAVSEPGIYKVFAEDGRELIGFVIPNLLDTDGEPLPLSLFTNGSQATVQAEIHGEEAGEGANLPTGPIAGMGMFFEATPEGVRATIPMSIAGSYEQGGEPTTFSGETFDGRPLEVSVQPNIAEPVGMEEGKLLIPQHWQWSPMDKAEQVSLASADAAGADGAEELPPQEGEEQPTQEEETPKESSAYVQIRSDGSTFTIAGPAVEKLAVADRSFLDVNEALFLLAGLGVEQGFGATKMAHALTGARPEIVKIGRLITTADEADLEARASAHAKLARVPRLKRDLVKEASVVSDPMAVDAVLSLGFINPENLMTFVSYLPQIDNAQMRLCELLLAARIGLQSVPESALERAVRSMEEAIEGLKVIAFSQ
jgi:hypothetical protein